MVYVKVARQHHRSVFSGQAVDSFHHQLCRLATRFNAHMVGMEVEEKEHFATFAHPEFSPSADAYASRIPTQRGFRVRRREPKVPVAELIQSVAPIKYGRIFARLVSIIAPNAHVIVVGQCAQQVVELPFQHLLRPKSVGMVEVKLVGYHLTTFRPKVSLRLIAVVSISYVIATQHKCLPKGSKGHAQHSPKQHKTSLIGTHNAKQEGC